MVSVSTDAERYRHDRYLEILTAVLRSDTAIDEENSLADLMTLVQLLMSSRDASPEQQLSVWLEHALQVRD